MLSSPSGHIIFLQINVGIATSHIASAIMEASFCSDFMQHTFNQSEWQDTTIFDTIDWEASSHVSLNSSLVKHLITFK